MFVKRVRSGGSVTNSTTLLSELAPLPKRAACLEAPLCGARCLPLLALLQQGRAHARVGGVQRSQLEPHFRVGALQRGQLAPRRLQRARMRRAVLLGFGLGLGLVWGVFRRSPVLL